MVMDEISLTQLRLKHQLHCCYHLSEAIGFKDRLNIINVACRSPTIIMAEDRVNRAGRDVKQYLVGQLHQFFAYMIEAGRSGVRLHEVILSTVPCPLYFDIEIEKKQPEGGYNRPVYRHILCGMEQRFCPSDSPFFPVAQLGEVSAQIFEDWATSWENILLDWEYICKDDFSESVSTYGIEYMEGFIRSFISHALDADLAGIQLKTITGCRYEKFSCRIFLPALWFDSNVVSMPLFVFELARAFQRENFTQAVTLLKLCESLKETGLEGLEESLLDKVRFHVRAVMLDKIPLGKADLDDVSNLRYSGIDDTPFNEFIYSMSRHLRCVGASKPSSVQLGPYVKGRDCIFPAFSVLSVFNPLRKELEDLTAERDQFASYLITVSDRCSLSDTNVVCRLQPTKSFPRPKWWERNKLQLRTDHGYDCDYFDFPGCRIIRMSANYVHYEEWRPTGRLLGRRMAGGSLLSMKHENLIQYDDEFVGEDGVTRPFWHFNKNAYVCCVHGEQSPSGCVFAQGVGYHCFGCNTTFYVDMGNPYENMYDFEDPEVCDLDEAGLVYMPDLPWDGPIRDPNIKFALLSSPMGSGKTHQLTRLHSRAKELGLTVLVVTHRQMLAAQVASLFGIPCYDSLAGSLVDYPSVVCCLNSLYKIPPAKRYDIVIFDEMGLIRRSYMASTMKKVLMEVLDAMRRLIVDAKLVVLAQDKFSRDDVAFYTVPKSVDPDDRRYIFARRFVKKIIHHPIEYTTEYKKGLSFLTKMYQDGMDRDGTMTTPFVVYCSTVTIAEFVVFILETLAPTEEAKGRIKGIWRSLKQSGDSFCERFSTEPNKYAHEADVLVCTSIIGAGFSINTHFVKFIAFFSNNILCTLEEQQFICRVRFELIDRMVPTCRQSYVYVQKGPGCNKVTGGIHIPSIKEHFNEFIKVISRHVGMPAHGDLLLRNTECDVYCEGKLSRLKHSQLFIDWLLSFSSKITEAPPVTEEDAETVSSIQSKLQKVRAKSSKTLVQYMINNKPLCRDTMLEDMEAFAYESEMYTMLRFYSTKAIDSIKQINEYAADEFHGSLFYLIMEKQGEKVFKRNLIKDHYALMKNVAGAVSWLVYLYPSATDFTRKFYKQVLEGRRHVEVAAKCWLLKHLLTPLLMGTVRVSDAYGSFLNEPASDPFLDGAVITVFTRQKPSMDCDTVTPLLGAVREIAEQRHDIKQPLLLLKAKGVKDLGAFTEYQIFHIFKGCLRYAGCDLVAKTNSHHQFVVKGRPYLLALAFCTTQFRRNLVNIYDGISSRQNFGLQPPPVTYLLHKALQLYDDCAIQLSRKQNVNWTMPPELCYMKERLHRWHEDDSEAASAISREDIVWDNDSVAMEQNMIETTAVDVRGMIRDLQRAEEASLHNRLLMQAAAIQVTDESSHVGEDTVRVPVNPFIDDAAVECNEEDDERIRFNDDISDLTF